MVGTAGSGKTLLASRLLDHYTRVGASAAVLNMDPGADSLPYSADIDVRDYVDAASIMREYELGPNGAMIMAADIMASKADVIRAQIDSVNPEYLIVDTPGQIELFAYRASGPFLAEGVGGEQSASVFLYDGALVTSPANFVSVALLSVSIGLRLGIPMLCALTKTDLIGAGCGDIMEWSQDPASLGKALSERTDGDSYMLASEMLRGLETQGAVQDIIPVSSVTGDGMPELWGALSRMINQGEEVED